MSCNNSFPVFLLYNWGKLTGFGWAMIADVTSNRVEHPSKNEIKVRIFNSCHLSLIYWNRGEQKVLWPRELQNTLFSEVLVNKCFNCYILYLSKCK